MTALLERESQLAALRAALEPLAIGDGTTVLVEGAPGVGKTTLLSAVPDLAPSCACVRFARGSRLERPFAFGVVRALLQPLVEARRGNAGLFRGAAAASAALFEPVADEPPAAAGQFPVLHALHWLTASLSAEQPLLLVVDDAHWADEASLRFLAFAASRVDDSRIGLVVGSRPSNAPEIVAIRSAARAAVDPLPLSRAGTGDLLARLLPRGPAPRLVDACHEATGGNPFYLVELAREIAGQEHITPDEIPELGPEAIARGVLARVGALGDDAVAVARAVAVLGEAPIGMAARMAGLDEATTLDAADALAGAQVLARDHPLRFLHPVIGSAIRRDMSPARRAFDHARAASLLHEAGATDEVVAAHLLQSEPAGPGWAAERLRRAGDEAMLRWAPAQAAAYFERARREPLPAAEGWRLLLAQGLAEFHARAPEAIDHLAAAAADAPDLLGRVTATRPLAAALTAVGRHADAYELLEAVLAAVPDTEREMRLTIEGDALTIAQVGGVDLFGRLHERISGTPQPAGDTPGERLVLAALAFYASAVGRPQEAARLGARALASGTLLTEQAPDGPTYSWAVLGLLAADRLNEAEAALTALFDDAARRGSALGFAIACATRGSVHVRRGDILALQDDAELGLEAAKVAEWSVGAVGLRRWLMVVAMERGDLPTAERIATELGQLPETLVFATNALFERGRLRIAQGRWQDAVDDLLEVGRRERVAGMCHPTQPWRLAVAPALIALGDIERARELAEEALSRARRGGVPRLIGEALHARALSAPADDRIDCLREAAAALADTPGRLSYAKAIVDLGVVLRHAGRRVEAREALATGMDVAHACGATAVEQRALAELRIAGARPRRPALSGVEALTPSERRVAELAARGQSNPEIAQSLFISRKTVEMHLGRVYRKLDISSREDLGPALGPPGGAN